MLWSLPVWYFGAIGLGFHEGPIGAIPMLGTISLVIGLLLLVRWRSHRLWWFAVPVLADEVLMVIAALAPQSIEIGHEGSIMLLFLGAQLAGGVWLLWYNRRAWQPALAFLLFDLTLAAFSTFIAAMALTGNWI